MLDMAGYDWQVGEPELHLACGVGVGGKRVFHVCFLLSINMWKQKATYRSSMPIRRRKTLAPGAKKGYTTPCGAGNSRGIGGMLTCVGGRELALPAAAVLFCFHAFIIPFGGISLQPNAGLFSR